MKLAAIGSNCVDYYLNLEGGKGFPGGGPVNMAVYTVRIGGQATYFGPVGNDKNGQLMLRKLEEKSVDISHITVKEGKTAITEVELKDNERIFGDYHEGVMKDYSLSADDLEKILQYDVVVADLWGHSEGYLKKLKQKGMLTAFDCADDPDHINSTKAIPYSDILFFSVEKNNIKRTRSKMEEIQQKGPKLVIAMLGEQGSLCYDGEQFYSFGIVPCEKVVDTMGAGDSYIAGFLKGYLETKNIKKAMQLGAETATETISYFGAW